LTLRGRYGARTTRDRPGDPRTSVLYVAAPITVEGSILGVLTIGKPAQSTQFFMNQQRLRLFSFVGFAVLFSLVPSLVFSWLLSRPLEKLTVYAREVRDGSRKKIPEIGRGEVADLAQAFEEMRAALEGKKYVERYIETLTHELKAPLSAIRGAAEFLESEIPEPDRETFARNIRLESKRMQEVIERLLELASLESRSSAERAEDIDLETLIRELEESFSPLARMKGIDFSAEAAAGQSVHAERFLLFRALSNLLQNAFDFTPEGGRVEIRAFAEGGFCRVCRERLRLGDTRIRTSANIRTLLFPLPRGDAEEKFRARPALCQRGGGASTGAK